MTFPKIDFWEKGTCLYSEMVENDITERKSSVSVSNFFCLLVNIDSDI